MSGGDEETPQENEEIPQEVEDQFGPPPEENAEGGEEIPSDMMDADEGEQTGDEIPTDMTGGEEEEGEEEAPTPELASYAFREKRKNLFLEKQKALKFKNKVIDKIINEEKIKEEKKIVEEKEKVNIFYKTIKQLKKKKNKKPKKNFSIEYMENNNEFTGINKILSKENTFFD